MDLDAVGHRRARHEPEVLAQGVARLARRPAVEVEGVADHRSRTIGADDKAAP